MASRFASEVLALTGRDLIKLRLIKSVPITSPAPGVDWFVTVPGGVIWELLSVFFSFASSAVVANRLVTMFVRDADGNSLFRVPNPTTQTAGVGLNYSYGAGVGFSAATGAEISSLPSPPIVLLPGWTLRTITSGIDVADQFSLVNIQVREWDETAIIQEAQELFTGLDEYVESGYREGSDY